MSKYNYKTGVSDAPTGFLSHLGTRLLAVAVGVTVGFYAGAMVVIGEIQAATPTQASSLSVQPVGVTSFNQMTEPSDFQPALGYGFVQYGLNDQVVQPATHSQNYQRPAPVAVYQPTVTDYQLQGEQLQLN